MPAVPDKTTGDDVAATALDRRISEDIAFARAHGFTISTARLTEMMAERLVADAIADAAAYGYRQGYGDRDAEGKAETKSAGEKVGRRSSIRRL